MGWMFEALYLHIHVYMYNVRHVVNASLAVPIQPVYEVKDCLLVCTEGFCIIYVNAYNVFDFEV